MRPRRRPQGGRRARWLLAAAAVAALLPSAGGQAATDAMLDMNPTESGGLASFNVRLMGAAPAADVTVTSSIINTGNDASPPVIAVGSSLIFTPMNFVDPQPVQLRGEDDDTVDGAVAFEVSFVVSGGGSGYDIKSPPNIKAATEDDDQPTATRATPAGTATDEMGASFDIILTLDKRPLLDVTITAVSSDTSEVLVGPAVTFTGGDFATGKGIAVTGQDDDIADGAQAFEVSFVVTGDPLWAGIAIPVVSGTNSDDGDTAGVVITQPTGVPAEADPVGTQATVSIKLQSEPTAPVTISYASSDSKEGTISGRPSMTFTAATWDTAQLLTLRAVNDAVDDDGATWDVSFSVGAFGEETGYDGPVFPSPSPITITNTDDDTAGVAVTPLAGTPDEGNAASEGVFTVVLRSQPTAPVTVELIGSDDTEGVVATGSSIVFNPMTWNIPQDVRVRAVDDSVNDDGKSWEVRFTFMAAGEMTGYDGPAFPVPDPITIVNKDDDDAGVFVSKVAGALDEATPAGMATFSVSLTSEPDQPVTVALTNVFPEQGGFTTQSTLIFTATDWSTAQVTTLTAIDDAVNDDTGSVEVSFVVTATAESTGYTAITAVDPMKVPVADNDDAGVVVSTFVGACTEADPAATRTTFTVKLSSEPTQDVVVGVVSSDSMEGVIVAGASLTFTPADWAAPQDVGVEAVDDAVDDDGKMFELSFTVAAAGETSGYGSPDVAPPAAALSCEDNDEARVVVTTPDGTETSEAGDAFVIEVAITTQPADPVTVTATITDALAPKRTEARPSDPVTFTAATWNDAQTITVTGVNDAYADGDTVFNVSLAVTGDMQYVGLPPVADIEGAVNKEDTDAMEVRVSSPSAQPDEAVNPAGGVFTVVLGSMPTAPVTISMTSSVDEQGGVAVGSLTFDETNWSEQRSVTVTAVDDEVDDGDQEFMVNFTVAAVGEITGYDGVAPPEPIRFTAIDDDVAGISLLTAPLPAVTAEGGRDFTITLSLDTKPTADVVVTLTPSPVPFPPGAPAAAEATASPSNITISPDQWQESRVVTVTGADDDYADGDQMYDVVVAVASADAMYDMIPVEPVAAVNADDDKADIVVQWMTTDPPKEADPMATRKLAVKLTSRPTVPVTISLVNLNPQEGVVLAGTSMTFAAGADAWRTPQTATVGAVDDNFDDDEATWDIQPRVTAPGEATGYDKILLEPITIKNLDDDEAGFFVILPAGSRSTESGGQFDIAVALRTEPLAPVTIIAQVSDDGEAQVSRPLTFAPSEFSEVQTMRITGMDDDAADGDQTYDVELTALSRDSMYGGQTAAGFEGVNEDNDVAGMVVSDVIGAPGEDQPDLLGEFTVTLGSQPAGNVTVTLENTDPLEGDIRSATELFFDELSWRIPQTVQIAAVDDLIDDDGRQWKVELTSTAFPRGDAYQGLSAVMNYSFPDNDAAGVVVSAVSGDTSEGGRTADFGVKLATEPVGPVTIVPSPSDPTEGFIESGGANVLVFDATTWRVFQTVTVTGVDDQQEDGPVEYEVTLTAASFVDMTYNALPVEDTVVLRNQDDGDASGILVSAPDGPASEAGRPARFTVTLATEPLDTITVMLRVDDDTEAAAAVRSLIFAPERWQVPQTAAIIGVADDTVDGDTEFTVTVTAASDADPNYPALPEQTVALVNEDVDRAGVAITPLDTTPGAPVRTTEAGGVGLYTVQLTSKPVAVSPEITWAVGNSKEGDIKVATLVFNEGNWDVPQTVSVTGVDDVVDDGNVAYIVTGTMEAAGLAASEYANVSVPPVSMVNMNDDFAGVVTTNVTGSVTEDGGQGYFTVRLGSRPSAPVNVPLESGDDEEVVLSVEAATFTPDNWNVPQTVYVTGLKDGDGDQRVRVLFGKTRSRDPQYDGLAPDSGNLAFVNAASEDEGGSGFPFLWIIVIILVIVACVLAVLLMQRRKRDADRDETFYSNYHKSGAATASSPAGEVPDTSVFLPQDESRAAVSLENTMMEDSYVSPTSVYPKGSADPFGNFPGDADGGGGGDGTLGAIGDSSAGQMIGPLHPYIQPSPRHWPRGRGGAPPRGLHDSLHSSVGRVGQAVSYPPNAAYSPLSRAMTVPTTDYDAPVSAVDGMPAQQHKHNGVPYVFI